ncbi:(2Fe-2S) ferredoxin domain-containing protein [Pantanalinema sp. GBBB05]|uniref:(2Fe-2S) ferredoxin domain-containing protein n=1 Tax=Pantanalinema sp. GBBB05 TaxID=2604139 RepID=UPI001DDF8730|nr:(2Fe-2S) ferredoxin domain-containing protein [Pantanalinema sp. GBBB05]
MSSSRPDRQSSFQLEGEFLTFVAEAGKIKYLRLIVANDEVQIKLSKAARASLFQQQQQSLELVLRPWDRIQIIGEQKLDRHSNIKLKAHDVVKLNQNCSLACRDNSDSTRTSMVDLEVPSELAKSSVKLPSKLKARLLICQKSGCQKRGGNKQHQKLEALLHDRGIQHLVRIETTGCLGKCSMAPNIMLMPGKQRLSGMKPEAIVELLEMLK